MIFPRRLRTAKTTVIVSVTTDFTSRSFMSFSLMGITLPELDFNGYQPFVEVVVLVYPSGLLCKLLLYRVEFRGEDGYLLVVGNDRACKAACCRN